MKQQLFQYAILWHPKTKKEKDEAADGESTKVIKELTCMLATDSQTAFMKAVREIPEEYMKTLDQVEIMVRPF